MVDMAAGMCTMGLIPFCSTFAMFGAGRVYEQIRNSIAYPRLNVKLCMSHAGVSVGEDGASHQCLEDLALMRVIPGMTVICPADAKRDPEGGVCRRGDGGAGVHPPGPAGHPGVRGGLPL